MIHLIIFSKNRAMQLDLLLRSIKSRADIFGKTTILYTADKKHKGSYRILHKEHNVELIEEDNFYKDVLELATECEFTCLGVDDDYFYQAVPKYRFWDYGDANSFSLRLGPNVKNKVHFQYPASLDFHIYRTKDLHESLLKCKEFKNPNQMESSLCGVFPKNGHRYSSQYVVGIPANRVSDTSTCSFGDQHQDELLEKYMQGKRIIFPKLSEPDNVHVDVQFELT